MIVSTIPHCINCVHLQNVLQTSSVPIFDARVPLDDSDAASSSNKNITPRFQFTSKDIKRIPKLYAKYAKGEEIPNGALAMIGYTVGSYEKDGDQVLTPNLNWVVVIAADD